jgi:hypothetical protein
LSKAKVWPVKASILVSAAFINYYLLRGKHAFRVMLYQILESKIFLQILIAISISQEEQEKVVLM